MMKDIFWFTCFFLLLTFFMNSVQCSYETTDGVSGEGTFSLVCDDSLNVIGANDIRFSDESVSFKIKTKSGRWLDYHRKTEEGCTILPWEDDAGESE